MSNTSTSEVSEGVRRGRKFDQVIAGASTVFLRDGFEGASVDDIARAAGVSKATLYSYFPDKKLLFAEVASEQCRQQSDKILAKVDGHQPLSEVLMIIGCSLLEFFYSETGLRMFRVVLGEAERFPELGKEFYHSGPGYGRGVIAQLLQEANERGETNIEDVDFAASQFLELCKSDLWARVVMGVRDSVQRDEIERVVQETIKMFMARYGVAQSDT